MHLSKEHYLIPTMDPNLTFSCPLLVLVFKEEQTEEPKTLCQSAPSSWLQPLRNNFLILKFQDWMVIKVATLTCLRLPRQKGPAKYWKLEPLFGSEIPVLMAPDHARQSHFYLATRVALHKTLDTQVPTQYAHTWVPLWGRLRPICSVRFGQKVTSSFNLICR